MGDERWRDLDAAIRPGQRHHRSWYAVALSDEVRPGVPFGCEFLNGRVAVYRRASGAPVVLSARCPHMGADLALGDVVGDDLRCTYHHFRFGPGGGCTAIPCDGPIPPGARVFSYPCAETLGVIWAFNGEAPDFAPPAVRDFAPGELRVRARRAHVFGVAPWISVGNTFDFLHLRHVHGLAFDFDPSAIRWLGDHQIEYEIEFRSPELGRFEQRIRVSGPNVVSYVTAAATTSIGLFTSTPVARAAQSFVVAAVPDDPALPAAELEERLRRQEALMDALLADDARTLTGIRFKVGTLVGDDRAMARFLRWVAAFPTAAPAVEFD
ncbi:MAG TPA: Rieske 2Fe-2S domain-containing protein [Myxococcota bacterium]|nr:Rieske 2Fe-2S domain-containing protein [Myxococcota bacterium]